MDNATLHRKASELIKLRRAIKKLEMRDTHLGDQIKDEMTVRRLIDIPSGIICPAGDITVSEVQIYELSLEELFKHFRPATIRNRSLVKPLMGNMRSAKGDDWMSEHCETGATRLQLKTMPAKTEIEVNVVISGNQPAT